jgi:hypothetical protein
MPPQFQRTSIDPISITQAYPKPPSSSTSSP